MSLNIGIQTQGIRSKGDQVSVLTAEALDQLTQEINSLGGKVSTLSSSTTGGGTTFPQDGDFTLMAHLPTDLIPASYVSFFTDAGLALEQISHGGSSIILSAVAGSNRALFYVSPTLQTEIRQDGMTVTGANILNVGADFATTIAGGAAGKIMWSLEQIANKGVFRLANGSGAGGWDTQGSSIYGTGVDGQLRAGSLVLGNAAGGNRFNGTADTFTSLHNNVAGHTSWSLSQSSGIGTFVLGSGSGVQGFDTQGAGFQADGNGNVFANLMLVRNSFPLSGSQVNIGPDYANAILNGGSSGLTLWALGQSGSKGILRISNGSGAGGLDGNGAYVYADGTNLHANTFLTNTISLSSNLSPTADLGASLGDNTHRWFLGQIYDLASHQIEINNGTILTSIGSSIGSIALSIQASSLTGNQMNAGVDFVNSLKNGTAGDTIWALAQSGNKGVLRISDGSGAGGLDGNGAYVYADGSFFRTTNLVVTGSVTAPGGAAGITTTNFLITHITTSGGLVTAVS